MCDIDRTLVLSSDPSSTTKIALVWNPQNTWVPGEYSLCNDLTVSAVVGFEKTLAFYTSVFPIMGAMKGFATIVFRVEWSSYVVKTV
jgi:hypothetical protein